MGQKGVVNEQKKRNFRSIQHYKRTDNSGVTERYNVNLIKLKIRYITSSVMTRKKHIFNRSSTQIKHIGVQMAILGQFFGEVVTILENGFGFD